MGSNRDEGMLVLAPLGVEAWALRAGLGSAAVRRTGMGPKRAAAAGRDLRNSGSAALAVAGFCGALDPAMGAGDLVVASEIRRNGSVVPCPSGPLLAASLRALGHTVHCGPIVSVDRVIRGRAMAELRDTGALAVDTESAWLADAAAGRPFAVVRAVVDAPGRDLLRNPLRTLRGGARAFRSLRQAGPALEWWGAAVRPRRVLLAGPRSFCAGVERAIEIVERALDRHGPPVYVRKQIVHNVHVVRDLERRGAVFVEETDEVPEGSTVVFSAHGVSPEVRDDARGRGLHVIDATCPLVTKVHTEARRFAKAGYTIFLVGHEGHEEVEGTTGEAPEAIRLLDGPASAGGVDPEEVGDPEKVAFLTQTTLAVDEVSEVVQSLRERFPQLAGPGSDDICYATQNRQDAVKALARDCDLLLVIGSKNSSNSKRLVEVSEREGCRSELIDDEGDILLEWLRDASVVGLTAGASAPELLVNRVIEALAGLGPVDVQERHVIDESMRFTLPVELR
jgi:4-hydroxy-3-methylbut-2-enyl diphosphate reductase